MIRRNPMYDLDNPPGQIVNRTPVITLPKTLADEIARMQKAEEPPDETITLQEAWNAAGGNPGTKPTREELLTALHMMDEIVDFADELSARPHMNSHYAGVIDQVEELLRTPAASAKGRRDACERLVAAVERILPYVDAIVCYASTCGEYEPNAIAKEFHEAYKEFIQTRRMK